MHALEFRVGRLGNGLGGGGRGEILMDFLIPVPSSVSYQTILETAATAWHIIVLEEMMVITF